MNDKETRIKIAIQKSGRLTEHSLELLEHCGLKYTRGRDQLIAYGENMPVDLLFVRDDDIPGLVRDDICDLGIAGLNVVTEKRLQFLDEGVEEPYTQVYALDYGHCRLSFGNDRDSKGSALGSERSERRILSSELQLLSVAGDRFVHGVELVVTEAVAHDVQTALDHVDEP